jgi:hypothetical protein
LSTPINDRIAHVAGDRAAQKVLANQKIQGDHNAATGRRFTLGSPPAVLIQIVARQRGVTLSIAFMHTLFKKYYSITI